MLVVSENIQIPLGEIEFSFARSGGPGGQNVNKVNSKATLRWSVVLSSSISEEVKKRFMNSFANRISAQGDLVLTSQRHRDQKQNVDDCLDKLKTMLLSIEKPPKKRKQTKPTKAMVEKRLDTKKQQSKKKSRRRAPEIDQF